MRKAASFPVQRAQIRKTVCEGRCLLTLTNTPAPKQLRLRYGKRRHAGQNDNAHSQKNEFGREICDFKIAASEEPKSSNRKSPLFVQVSRRQWTTGDDRLHGLESHPLRYLVFHDHFAEWAQRSGAQCRSDEALAFAYIFFADTRDIPEGLRDNFGTFEKWESAAFSGVSDTSKAI